MLRDDHSSGPRITARLKRPTRRWWRAEPARVPGKAEALPGNPSLFGLAPCGVCPARRITASAVRSYRTFSPLPEPCGPGGMFSVALSVESTHPCKERKDGPPSRTLSGTLLCGVRTFLCFATATVRSSCQPFHYSAGGWRRPILRTPNLTPPLWVRGRMCTPAVPSRSTRVSVRRDKPVHRAPAHAEAP